jgi:hypothetical protein
MLIASLFGSDMNLMDMFTSQKSTDYQKFSGKLQANEAQQGKSLQILQQAMPYAQTKEELGQLMNMYRSYLGQTQTAPFTAPNDVYNLTTIPGMTGNEHGGSGPAVDWGPQTEVMQKIISAYQSMLPGASITDMGATPSATGPYEAGAYAPGTDWMRLWQQFTDREQTAPTYVPTDNPGVEVGGGEGTTWIEGTKAGWYGAGGGPGSTNTTNAVGYGQPGYNYAGSGYPDPGQYVGAPSPIWNTLLNPSQNQSSFNSLNIPSANPGATSNLLGSLGFAGLKGPQSELAGAENPNRL